VRAGCDGCHAGPLFTDHWFHNVGTPGGLVPFTGVDTSGDRGAADGLALARMDPLGMTSEFSDGQDSRFERVPGDLESLVGAFRTPSLRCIEKRPSFMHNGEFRSLYDVIRHFSRGTAGLGAVGSSEIEPLDLDADEQEDLVAFLLALEGPGPAPELLLPPELPSD